jgi:hypothetical protein
VHTTAAVMYVAGGDVPSLLRCRQSRDILCSKVPIDLLHDCFRMVQSINK